MSFHISASIIVSLTKSPPKPQIQTCLIALRPSVNIGNFHLMAVQKHTNNDNNNAATPKKPLKTTLVYQMLINVSFYYLIICTHVSNISHVVYIPFL